MDKWRKYWAYAGERAIKTVAQTAIATLTAAGVVGVALAIRCSAMSAATTSRYLSRSTGFAGGCGASASGKST